MQWVPGISQWFYRATRRGVVGLRIFFGLTGSDADPRAGGAAPMRPPHRPAGYRETGAATRESAPLEPDLPTAAPSALDTAELCRAWRVSSATLRRPLSASDLDRTAELRHGYLEELERRDPAGFQRWLYSHRGAQDPNRFFHHPSRR